MTSSTMGIAESMKKPVSASSKAGRLHYLDWLRVILLFKRFLIRRFFPC